MSEAVATRESGGVFAGFAGLARALSALRAPFAMAGLTILALWLPQQVREVYRVLAQPAAAQPSTLQWQWVLAAVSLGLLAIVLWQASREIAHLASADQSLDRQPVAKAVLDWAPRLFATAPFVGVALGTWYSFLPSKRTLGTTMASRPCSCRSSRMPAHCRRRWPPRPCWRARRRSPCSS